MKKTIFVFILLTSLFSCKKEKPTVETPTTASTIKIDNIDYKLSESQIKTTLYKDDGDNAQNLEIVNLFNTNDYISLYLPAFKDGSYNINKQFPSVASATMPRAVSGSRLYDAFVKLFNNGKMYFANGGSVSVSTNSTGALINWSVTFTDANGKSFTSTGKTNLVNYQTNTKPKSQMNNPMANLTITSISPDYGSPGSEITITGTGFSGVLSENIVMLNDAPIEITAASATQLKAIIPAINYTGSIRVKVLNNIADGPVFTYAPEIITLTHNKAEIGQEISIAGKYFIADATKMEVKVNGIIASITNSTQGNISFTIPDGATTGKVSVAIKGRPAVSTTNDLEIITPPLANTMSVPIGKTFTNMPTATADKNTIVDYYAGKHHIGIYYSKDDYTNTVGSGQLFIARNGNQLSLTIKGKKGDVLAENSIDLVSPGQYHFLTLNPTLTAVSVPSSSDPNTRISININFSQTGEITGEVWFNSVLKYKFRNNILYFGTTPPNAIVALQGTWKSQHTQPTCGTNPITTTITSIGQITITGKTSLNCNTLSITNTWDGNDDYVRPNSPNWTSTEVANEIFIDEMKSGASNPEGGIRIMLSTLNNPTSIVQVRTTGAWAAGEIISSNPAKQ